jgi:hypothetical protein
MADIKKMTDAEFLWWLRNELVQRCGAGVGSPAIKRLERMQAQMAVGRKGKIAKALEKTNGQT